MFTSVAFYAEDKLRVQMKIRTFLLLSCLSSLSRSRSWFSPEPEEESGLLSYWTNWTEAEPESDWDRNIHRLEEFWDNVYSRVRGFDYSKLHQAITEELNENLPTVTELGEQVKNSMKAGGETLTNEWRKKYNQSANLLKEIKTNIKLSKLFDKKELTKQIDDYSKLHQTITDELNVTVTELGVKVTNLMKTGGETLTNEWRKKYNQTANLLTEIKTNIKLSKLIDKKELAKQIDDFLTAWGEFSVYELVQRSYRELSQDDNKTNNISVTDLVMSVKSSLSHSGVSSYLMVEEYLEGLQRSPPVCTDKVLTCPDGV